MCSAGAAYLESATVLWGYWPRRLETEAMQRFLLRPQLLSVWAFPRNVWSPSKYGGKFKDQCPKSTVDPHGLNSCRLVVTEDHIYYLSLEVITSRPRWLRKELNLNARGAGKIPGSMEEGSWWEHLWETRSATEDVLFTRHCVTVANDLTETTSRKRALFQLTVPRAHLWLLGPVFLCGTAGKVCVFYENIIHITGHRNQERQALAILDNHLPPSTSSSEALAPQVLSNLGFKAWACRVYLIQTIKEGKT